MIDKVQLKKLADEIIAKSKNQQFNKPAVKRNKSTRVKSISRDELWELWLIIEDLGELLSAHIEAGADNLDDLSKRKSKAQKMIQRYRRVKLKR